MSKQVKVRAKVSMSGYLLEGKKQIDFVAGQVLWLPEEDAKRWLGFHVELAGPDEAVTETAALGSADYSFVEGDDPRLLQRLRGVILS